VRQLAGFFPATEYPDVLVGLGEPDDAAVVRLDETRALINTTDFFTPIVDDPWTYGAIAAANAMSDVYAMGGEVLFVLNIAGFPEDMDAATIAQVFTGGAAKVREAGAAVAGGHTITNPEPFYGLAVTGLIHPDQVLRKGGAQAGDQLYLTKPLGTGIITTAAKLTGPGENPMHRLARKAQGKPDLDVRDLDEAVVSMLRLNRVAARAAHAAEVCSATDVTGFGLLGHASEMAIASGREQRVSLVIEAATVPALPGVHRYIEAGYLTRAATRNPQHFGQQVRFAANVSAGMRTLLWEAETSGGLLLAVPKNAVAIFEQHCAENKQPAWRIGEVVSGDGIQVV
jgi:selenide,water dikinase